MFWLLSTCSLDKKKKKKNTSIIDQAEKITKVFSLFLLLVSFLMYIHNVTVLPYQESALKKRFDFTEHAICEDTNKSLSQL